MTFKQDLIDCTSNNSWRNLPTLLSHLGKRPFHSSELQESLEDLSHSQQNQLWESIFDFAKALLATDVKNAGQEQENGCIGDAEVEDSEVFHSIVLLASTQVDLIASSKEVRFPEKLVQLVVFIGGSLRDLEAPVQSDALNLCESWVLKSLDRCEEISPEIFIILIGESLQDKAKKQCVKRVWVLRRCLALLAPSLGGDCNHPLDQLLLSCCEASVYLSSEDGLKFLTLVMGMPPMTKNFHKVVKTCLPKCSKAEAVKYAQVYFRAWRDCQGNQKKIFEEECLQDLMYHAVHVDRSSSLTVNIFAFMSYIHKQNKHQPTASMIHSLYSPFLWRSLKVANGTVRLNAATILCDAFPLSDTSLSKEENEGLLEQQYHALVSLLTDPSHLVRIAVIKGVFNILCNYWLVVPSHVIHKIFSTLLGKLICDASSAEVRAQVVKGVTQLLEITEATPFLVNVLPRIAETFDDVNASVRLACVKLLERVKLFNTTKFWDLVPLEHLLHSICEDSASRSSTIQLIQSVFFPLHLGEKEMLRSCITLLEMDREAGRWFYQQIGKNLDIETTSKFMSLIWRTISRYASLNNLTSQRPSTSSGISDESESSPHQRESNVSKKTNKKKSKKGPNKENKAPDGVSSADSSKEEISKDDESKQMPLDNPEITLGLLDTIVVLWTGKFHVLSLPENLKYIEGLQTRLSKTYPLVWGFFKESPEISKTLVYLASFLPSNLVPTLAGLCTSRIRSFTDSQISDESFGCYLNALCNWNRVDDIIEIISEWIEKAFESADGKRTPKKNAKKVCFRESSPNPLLALRFLRHLLQHPLNKISLLQKNRHLLLNLSETLSCVKELLIERVHRSSQLSCLCTDEFLFACWRDYLCVVTVLHFKGSRDDPALAQRRNHSIRNSSNVSEIAIDEFDSVEIFAECRNWVKNEILSAEDLNASVRNSNFLPRLFDAFLNASASLIAIGAADLPFVYETLNFAETIIDSCAFLPALFVSCAHLIIESHRYLSSYTADKLHEDPSSSCTYRTTCTLITVLSNQASELTLNGGESESIRMALESLLLMMNSSKSLAVKISEEIVKHTLTCLRKQLELSGDSSLPEYNSIKEMKNLPRIMMSSIHKKAPLIESFVGALRRGVSEVDFDICEVLAALLILSALEEDRGKLSVASWKNAVLAIEELLRRLTTDLSSTNEEEISALETDQLENKPFVRFCSDKSKDLLDYLKRSIEATNKSLNK